VEITAGTETQSWLMCDISQLPVSFDAVPDRQGCPCMPTEVGVDSASIQMVSPENIEITAGTETQSWLMCDISELPVSIDAIPDRQGCPCVPTELGVDSVSIQLDTLKNIGIALGIIRISQYMTEMSQLPVSSDAVPDIQGCPCLLWEVGVGSLSPFR